MDIENRNKIIHAKGFNINDTTYNENVPTEYRKIKVGVKNLEDATLNLGSLKANIPNHNYTNKAYIYKAILENNISELRKISQFYYNISGIYQRACDYFAFLYRYDWYVAAETYDDSVKTDKVLIDLSKVLNFLDKSYIKKICGDIAL